MIYVSMILTKLALIDSFNGITNLSSVNFFLLILSVLLIAAGGNIVNDIFDIEADKINKPNKVIVNAKIPKSKALNYYWITSILGVIFGVFISITTELYLYSLLFLFSFLGLYVYSHFIKKIVILGNIVVSFLCALPIVIVFLFSNTIYSFDFNSTLFISVFVFASFAFLTTLIREIIKDIEDVDGDLKLNAKTLPIVLGRKRAKNIAVVLTLILLFSLIQIAKDYLYFYPILLGYTFIFILLPLSYFTYQLWNAETKKQFYFLSNFMKLIMFLGVLSMLLFRFN